MQAKSEFTLVSVIDQNQANFICFLYKDILKLIPKMWLIEFKEKLEKNTNSRMYNKFLTVD